MNERGIRDIGPWLNRAKERLNQGDAAGALKVLEDLVDRDVSGRHTSSALYYLLLEVCQTALDLDPRQARGQALETSLDWLSSLKKGQELLRVGRAEESIAYFRRSLRGNPGEAGTASAEDAARRGIEAAEALLKNKDRT